jgi:hypothetical protein
LALHPNVQQRAREEVLSILGDESKDIPPTIEDIKRMEYLNQIVKEVSFFFNKKKTNKKLQLIYSFLKLIDTACMWSCPGNPSEIFG